MRKLRLHLVGTIEEYAAHLAEEQPDHFLVGVGRDLAHEIKEKQVEDWWIEAALYFEDVVDAIHKAA